MESIRQVSRSLLLHGFSPTRQMKCCCCNFSDCVLKGRESDRDQTISFDQLASLAGKRNKRYFRVLNIRKRATSKAERITFLSYSLVDVSLLIEPAESKARPTGNSIASFSILPSRRRLRSTRRGVICAGNCKVNSS